MIIKEKGLGVDVIPGRKTKIEIPVDEGEVRLEGYKYETMYYLLEFK